MNEPNMYFSMIKIFSSLLILIGVLLLMMYLAKKINQKSRGKQLIQIVSSIYIGAKRGITIAKIPGSVLVVGWTNNQIQLLEKITDDKRIALFTEGETKSQDFYKLFQRHTEDVNNN